MPEPRTFSPANRARALPALLLAALALFLNPPALAQQYAGAEELMEAVSSRPEPATTQATLRMTITLGSGQSLSRELRMWADSDDRRLIKFTTPADIAGSGFLQLDDA